MFCWLYNDAISFFCKKGCHYALQVRKQKLESAFTSPFQLLSLNHFPAGNSVGISGMSWRELNAVDNGISEVVPLLFEKGLIYHGHLFAVTNFVLERLGDPETSTRNAFSVDIQPYYKSYSASTRRSLEAWNPFQFDYGLIAATIEYNCQYGGEGAILVFLIGGNKLLGDSYMGLILPLYGSMATTNECEIFDRPPSSLRKIVVPTNIAKSGITIDDVVHVVDCETTKETSYDARNKCEFSVGYSRSSKRTVGFMLGYFREGMIAIEEPLNCPNVYRIACEYALIFQQFLQSSSLPVWNRIDNVGCWHQFTVREGRSPGQSFENGDLDSYIADVMLIVQVCSSGVDNEVVEEAERVSMQASGETELISVERNQCLPAVSIDGFGSEANFQIDSVESSEYKPFISNEILCGRGVVCYGPGLSTYVFRS